MNDKTEYPALVALVCIVALVIIFVILGLTNQISK